MTRLLCCRMRRQRTIILFLFLFVVGNFVLYSKFKISDGGKELTNASEQKTEEKVPPEDSNSNNADVKAPFGIPSQLATSAGKPKSTDVDVKPEIVPSVVAVDKIKDSSPQDPSYKFKVAVLVIACNRPSVGRCLNRLLRFKPKNMNIPIVVSQDCGDSATESVIRSYGDDVELIKQPDLGDVQNVPPNMQRFMGYYKISRHFKFALSTTFNSLPEVDSVIIVEDDIDIASDFYEYFLATRALMEMDKSIWCVSAWNDNGKVGFVDGNDLLYRSDFFPGLGWMITRKIWEEIGPKWPLGFWDDWMRNPAQRKDRVCIRPEISRTKTFGRVGVSLGQFFDQHLKYIQLNEQHYPFLAKDLTYLVKDKYDKTFMQDVYNTPVISSDDLRIGNLKSKTVRLEYRSNPEFEAIARMHGVMTDLKAGVPRGAYRGVVTFMKNGIRVHLAPPKGWQGYHE